MKFQQKLVTIFLVTVSTTASAFQVPGMNNGNKQASSSSSSSAVDMTATTASFNIEDFDISAVLAQAEEALESAQLAVPKSKSIETGLAELVQLQTDMLVTENTKKGIDAGKLAKAVTGMEQDDLIAAAFATTAASVVVGSPLVLGAALGVAGSKLLDGEKGEQTKQMLGTVSKSVAEKMKQALAFAQQTIDEEDGDISKVQDKMFNLLKAKATSLTQEVKGKMNPQEITKQLKEVLESEDVKEAPGRAVNAFSAFFNSEEVKSAQRKALQALKAGMESDEMKALQNRASLALKETLESKKTMNEEEV